MNLSIRSNELIETFKLRTQEFSEKNKDAYESDNKNIISKEMKHCYSLILNAEGITEDYYSEKLSKKICNDFLSNIDIKNMIHLLRKPQQPYMQLVVDICNQTFKE